MNWSVTSILNGMKEICAAPHYKFEALVPKLPEWSENRSHRWQLMY
jgi:hypothetical protein